jgi:F0F1-type ATP synthase membrane subunit b/b'
MVVVTRNPKAYFVGLAVSLGIFLVLLFTVILPSTHTANSAIKSGEQQAQQVIKAASKQLNQAGATAAKSDAGASKQIKAADKKANQVVSKATQLTNCVAAAGTDTGKLASCQAKFG